MSLCRTIRISALCLLFYGVCSAAPLAPSQDSPPSPLTLRFPTLIDSTQGSANYSVYLKVVRELFQDSDVTIEPVYLPNTQRIKAEAARDNLDIAFAYISQSRTDHYLEDYYDLYPRTLGYLLGRYYALSHRQITGLDQNEHRLGLTRMPKPVAKTLLNITTDNITFYGNHEKLVKGLISDRVDIIASNTRVIPRVLVSLGVENRVEPLGSAFKMDILLGVRSNLPTKVKQQIFDILDQSTPAFIDQQRFEALTNQ